MDAFWAAPPVTRTLVAVTAIQSILVHSGLLGFRFVVFYSPWLTKFPPHIWRVLTPFFLTGPGLMLLFDLHFLWTYSRALETESPRFSQPGDYFTFLVFVATIILASAGFLLNAPVFTSALLLAIAYVYAQDNRGKRIGFILFKIPAQYLPYAMLALTLVLGGPDAALREGTGLLAGHTFDFLTRIYPAFQGGRNWVQTPRFISNAFGAGTPAWTTRPYGTAYRSGAAGQGSQPQQASSGWTSALGGNWRGRGAGRRLGGD